MMLEAGGGYLGSTLGAFAYDLLGFQWATVVESGVSLSFSSSTKDKDFLNCQPGDGRDSTDHGDIHASKADFMNVLAKSQARRPLL